MLRAEKRSQETPEAAGDTSAGEPRPAEPAGKEPRPHPPAGGAVVAALADAVHDAETRICGRPPVRSAAEAEGLALAGRRAACRLHRPDADRPAGAGAWVDHRLLMHRRPDSRGFAFELVAADPQEAIDHCLVAHRTALRLGRPGVCSLDRSLADTVAPVRLPGPVEIAALLDDVPTTAHAGAPPSDDEVRAALEESFAAVAEATGRRREPVRREGPADADVALVTEGAGSRVARAIAAELARRETPCAVVVTALVHPEPPHRREMLASLRAERAVSLVREGEVRTANRPATGMPAYPVRDAESFGSADLRSALGLPEAAEGPLVAGARIHLGCKPAGPGSERLLLALAATFDVQGGAELAHPSWLPGVSWLSLAVETRGADAGTHTDALFDLLICAPAVPAGRLTGTLELDAMREGGVLVLYDAGTDAEAPLPALDPALDDAQLEVIRTRRVRVVRLPAEELAGNPGDAVRRLRRLLPTASAAGGETPADLPEADLEPVDTRVGPVVGLEMPSPEGGDADGERQRALREFHLTAGGVTSPRDPLELLPLRPALLEALTGTVAPTGDPLVVSEDDARIGSLSRKLAGALGESTPMLGRHAGRMVEMAARLLRDRGGSAALGGLLDDLLATLPEQLDLSPAGMRELERESESLRGSFTSPDRVYAVEPEALPELYLHAVRTGRRERHDAFRDEIGSLIRRLEETLQADAARSPESGTPAALATTLGETGSEFLDTSALSENLPRQRGSTPIAAERRDRIESALTTLRNWRDGAGEPAPVMLLADDDPAAGPSGCRLVRHPDPLRTAIGVFDGLAGAAVEVLRAVRVARLEAEDQYDPGTHDLVIARLDWQGLELDELLLLPPVAVLGSGRVLRGPRLASFSELLRSGRPVHVLVRNEVAELTERETWEALAGYHPGLGYLAAAHREPLVVQSSLGHPDHLGEGLARIAGAPSPAVALVAVPSREAAVPAGVQLEAARFGRAAPSFTYDPERGDTWAERLDLAENPEPEQPWPSLVVEYRDAAGETGRLAEPFTFAHAAALDPAYRGHFRVVPEDGWSDNQVGPAEFLAASEDERRRLLPFVWVVGAGGRLARAVMTRELAYACRDRARAWRILQELAGTGNVHARRAAEAARGQAERAAAEERSRLEAEHAAELERVRERSAGEAMERLAAVLLDLDGLPAPRAAETPAIESPAPDVPVPAAAPETGPAAPAQEAEAKPAAETEDDEELLVEEPSIDSALCTTCNECTNLNARMFRYNADRQAELADVTAGTYAELVRAAEKCPARCIHPGAPRPGDPTATEEMVRRAEPFN